MSEQRDVMSLKPTDTPDYMASAWLGCIQWSIGKQEIVDAFRAESGNRWTPPRNGMELMADRATGADWAFIEAFVRWANVNVWGTMADPPDVTEDFTHAQVGER